jgi:hypothetical protein
MEIVAVGGAAIFAIAGSVTPASAEASTMDYAAHATAYQNAVLDDAMAHHPSGVRISVGQVKWPDGTIVGAPASPKDSAPSCIAGVFCQYNAANYTGSYLLTWNPGWTPFGECSPEWYPGCDTGTHSWVNNLSVRVWLEQFKNSGHEYCIAPEGLSRNWESPNFTGVNVDDYWQLLSTNPETC